MTKLIVSGPSKLKGRVKVSGAKNVAMKVIIAGLLTSDPIKIHNVPLISSVLGTIDIVRPLGVDVELIEHSCQIQAKKIMSFKVPLEMGGLYRTAPMVLGPLLARFGQGIVPNPGGCRLGKRPIDRYIDGLVALGARVTYRRGFFYARTDGLRGTTYRFPKNTHTGTEALILAAVLASGTTVLENAAAEPEVDDLISLLINMGARIERAAEKVIKIHGVKKLHGATFSIMPDRNEVVTFAVAAIATRGDVIVEGTERKNLRAFLDKLDNVGAGWQEVNALTTRFYYKEPLKATDLATSIYPGFMTDWQAPWAVLMTQANGKSIIHETVFEQRFGYVRELRKMGAKIDFFHPQVESPLDYYNFNWSDREPEFHQAILVTGPTMLHNAVVDMTDIRAGATLLIASLCAHGESVLHGIDHLDRGYEDIDGRFRNLGAQLKRTSN